MSTRGYQDLLLGFQEVFSLRVPRVVQVQEGKTMRKKNVQRTQWSRYLFVHYCVVYAFMLAKYFPSTDFGQSIDQISGHIFDQNFGQNLAMGFIRKVFINCLHRCKIRTYNIATKPVVLNFGGCQFFWLFGQRSVPWSPIDMKLSGILFLQASRTFLNPPGPSKTSGKPNV